MASWGGRIDGGKGRGSLLNSRARGTLIDRRRGGAALTLSRRRRRGRRRLFHAGEHILNAGRRVVGKMRFGKARGGGWERDLVNDRRMMAGDNSGGPQGREIR
jgi:hypothetical protein